VRALLTWEMHGDSSAPASPHNPQLSSTVGTSYISPMLSRSETLLVVSAMITGALAYLIMSKLSSLIDPLLVAAVVFTSGLFYYLLSSPMSPGTYNQGKQLARESAIESDFCSSGRGGRQTNVTSSIELKSDCRPQSHRVQSAPHYPSPTPPQSLDVDAGIVLRRPDIEGMITSVIELGSELDSFPFSIAPSPTGSSSAGIYGNADLRPDLRRHGQGSLCSPSVIEFGSVHKIISETAGYVDCSIYKLEMTLHLQRFQRDGRLSGEHSQ
jgi:hypothetical protein